LIGVERAIEIQRPACKNRSSWPVFPGVMELKSKTLPKTIVPRRRDFWRLGESPSVLLILTGNLLKHIRRRHTPTHCMMGEHPQLGSNQQSNEI